MTTPPSLFPDEHDINDHLAQQDARADFQARRWRPPAPEPARQAKLFDDLNWLPDQAALFDVNKPE